MYRTLQSGIINVSKWMLIGLLRERQGLLGVNPLLRLPALGWLPAHCQRSGAGDGTRRASVRRGSKSSGGHWVELRGRRPHERATGPSPLVWRGVQPFSNAALGCVRRQGAVLVARH